MSESKELKYWISFSRIPNIGRVKITQLVDYFGSLEYAWKASALELKQAGLDSRAVSNIINMVPKISPDDEIDRLDKYGIKAFIYTSSLYPQRLKEIHDFPPIIYVRGQMLEENEYCLAVVGTRRPTLYGRQVTEELVSNLVQNRITIVSGLAKGIDSIAHKTALRGNGRTIAVFASGLDIVYPAENVNLAREIMEQGALISEYPLGIRPKADNFPRRNRIMSGISLGVLAVEAGERSGALITTDQALNQDREVFAVPGSIFSIYSKGTNRLIQQGAKLVRTHIDVLEELNLAVIAQQLEMKDLLPENETEHLLLNQFHGEPVHIDDLCRKSGLLPSIVSSALTMMELKGTVKHVGSMNYIRAG